MQPIVLWSTGIAALNIWGWTVHSFFWLGVNDPDPMVEWSNRLKPERMKLIANAPFIVIDEVSMLHANVVDTIDKIIKNCMILYHNDWQYENLPFWWKVILFVWDMFQLPPVVTDRWNDKFVNNKLISYESAFFFDSMAFVNYQDYILTTELVINYRQWADKMFAEILDKVREWTHTYSDIAKVNSRLKKELPEDTIVLTTTNKNAEKINKLRLAKLIGKQLYSFVPKVDSGYPKNMYPIEWDLQIKAGAQVMLLNNDQEKRWVNWSIWEIVSVIDYWWEDEHIIVRIDWEEFTVKKNKRDYVDKMVIDVVDDNGNPVLWPTGKPQTKVVEDVIWSYIQYPMKLAWAITIHKSQWQTFKNVKIDMEWWAFADAQAYVALSRCQSLDWVSLLTWIKPDDIKVNKRVLSYYLKTTCKN